MVGAYLAELRTVDLGRLSRVVQNAIDSGSTVLVARELREHPVGALLDVVKLEVTRVLLTVHVRSR